MYIQRLPNIIYRQYSEFGYLTDNRNFGYDTATKSCRKVGDLLLSKVGCVFYSQLSYEPQNIDFIVKRLIDIFPNVSYSQLVEDAIDFYRSLSLKGFIVCGDDCQVRVQSFFSYNNTIPYDLVVEEYSSHPYHNVFAKISRLSRVHIDICSKCNEHCVHCYIPEKCKCGMMDEKMFSAIIRQCNDLNVINITLSGGEPLLNPYLQSFLQMCKEYNFSINILSNLTLLTDEYVEFFASNPLISIQTSVYAMDEKVHDAVTMHKGSFQKTIEAIYRLHRRNVPMQINCPIMKQNKSQYQKVLEFATSLNIEVTSDYTLFGCYDCSASNLSCRLDIDEVRDIIESDCHSVQKYEYIRKSLKDKNVGPYSPICPVCKNSLCISNTGNVYPCEGLQRLVVGNIENSSLRDIWEKAPLVLKLRDLRYSDFVKCRKCKLKRYCTTCLVMNANENPQGDYLNVNEYVCKIAEIKRRFVCLGNK